MKIVLCAHNYHPARGGAELVWKNVAERLTGRGHDVRVVATCARSTEDYFLPGKGRDLFRAGTEIIEGVPVTRVPFRRFGARGLNILRSVSTRLPIPGHAKWRALSWGPRGTAYGREVERLAREIEADVIVAGPLPTLVVDHARRAARRLGKPLVVIPCFHTEDKYSFDNPLYFKWLKDAAGLACFTGLESEYLAMKTGLPKERVRTAGIGLEIDAAFLPDAGIGAAREAAGKAVRERLGFPPAETAGPGIVLFFGQHVPHKGIIPLIDAMEIVWKSEERSGSGGGGRSGGVNGRAGGSEGGGESGSESRSESVRGGGGGEAAARGREIGSRLIIAGNPTSHTPMIMSRIAVLPEKYRSRIRMLHHVSESERTELFRAADIFVSVSPFESFGIVYLEAWREGTPVIACSRGASSHLVGMFRDGLLVRDADAFEQAGAIMTLLRDPELRLRMGMRGRAKVREQFDWESIAGNYEAFFTEVAKARRRP